MVDNSFKSEHPCLDCPLGIRRRAEAAFSEVGTPREMVEKVMDLGPYDGNTSQARFIAKYLWLIGERGEVNFSLYVRWMGWDDNLHHLQKEVRRQGYMELSHRKGKVWAKFLRNPFGL